MNLPVPFDFFPTHIDPKKFLECTESRQISDVMVDDILMFSPKNMDDEELAEAFIDDVLGVTMWEIQTGQTLNFNKIELLRYVSKDQHDRIWSVVSHESVVGLIQFNGDQIRIRNHREILHAAMDFCGTFYSGFSMPGGIVSLNTSLKDLVQCEEDLEALATALAMELQGQESNKTIN